MRRIPLLFPACMGVFIVPTKSVPMKMKALSTAFIGQDGRRPPGRAVGQDGTQEQNSSPSSISVCIDYLIISSMQHCVDKAERIVHNFLKRHPPLLPPISSQCISYKNSIPS